MPKKRGGCSLSTPARHIAPSPKEAPAGWSGLRWLVVAITTKRPGAAGALAVLTGAALGTFFMANVREMVNTHLPVALKLINSAALVAIALSTLCAAGSLREMSGRSAAPVAVTEAN